MIIYFLVQTWYIIMQYIIAIDSAQWLLYIKAALMLIWDVTSELVW